MRISAIVIGLVTVFATSALAAEWGFYGSARVATFQVDLETPTSDTDNFSLSLQSNARIGANVTVSDTLSGNFEYGASGGNVNLRNLYGEWDFGAGKLLVGQTYAPMNWFYSNQVFDADNDLNAQGFIYSGREPMVKLTFGTFQIALVEPDPDDLGTGFTSEVKIPAIEACYTWTHDFITLEAAGGYHSYELSKGGVTYDIDSHVLAAGAMLHFGAAFFNAAVFTGRNVGNLIGLSVDGDNAWDDGFAAISGTRVLDNDSMGYALVVGYKIDDMFTCEAGYGYAQSDIDTYAGEDDMQAYYANVTINLAPGVFVVPEIGRFDGKESGDAETTYYGAKWQINF
ncbi:MAG: hypothetical protein V2J08_02855 [Desulfotignum sp.]|jgi:hypothetical protein|nr:hypothetical protein [Desulfotignum sp.]